MASIESCEKEVVQKTNELNMQNLSKGGADSGNPWWGTLPENASVDAFAEQWKRTIGQNPQMEQTLVECIAILQKTYHEVKDVMDMFGPNVFSSVKAFDDLRKLISQARATNCQSFILYTYNTMEKGSRDYHAAMVDQVTTMNEYSLGPFMMPSIVELATSETSTGRKKAKRARHS